MMISIFLESHWFRSAAGNAVGCVRRAGGVRRSLGGLCIGLFSIAPNAETLIQAGPNMVHKALIDVDRFTQTQIRQSVCCLLGNDFALERCELLEEFQRRILLGTVKS